MRLRVYIDTSVIGGCLDEEFAEESKALLEMAEQGRCTPRRLGDGLSGEFDRKLELQAHRPRG